jgi:hypothetical protein
MLSPRHATLTVTPTLGRPCRRPAGRSQSGSAQLLLGSCRVAAPEVIEADHRATQLRRFTEHRVRDDRRQPHLQALDVPATRSNAAGRQSRHDAAALLPTADVLDDEGPVTQVDGHRDSRVRDHAEVDELRGTATEPGHADPRQPAGP